MRVPNHCIAGSIRWRVSMLTYGPGRSCPGTGRPVRSLAGQGQLAVEGVSAVGATVVRTKMSCPECSASLDDVPVGSPCPACGSGRRDATVSPGTIALKLNIANAVHA